MSDLIDRQAAIDALHMHLMYRMGTDSNKKRLDEWINNLPSAQPEPCDDPRADIYYLAEKIGIHRLYALVVELRGEPEPCEDTISRQQTITALRALSDEDGYINVPHEVVTDVVRGLPPVQAKHEHTTQPERGESDKLASKMGGTWVDVTCPNCGCEIHVESEIIKCGDCKYTDGCEPIEDGRYWCCLHGSFMYYCSDAERREDG